MAAVENEHGIVTHGSMDGPELAPYPPYVQTAEETERWDAAYGIAEGLSRLYERDGEPDARWVWYTTRALYADRSIPTGSHDVQEAADEGEERTRELLLELERRQPADPADADQMEAYLAALDRFLAGLLGDPDEWIPEDVERDYTHELAAAAVEEAMAVPHVPGTYTAALHPRTRGGKWARKFGAAHAIMRQHPDAVERHLTAGRPEAHKQGLRQKLHKARVVGTAQAQYALAMAATRDNPIHSKIKSSEHPALKGRKNAALAVADAVLPDPRHAAAGHHAAAANPGQDTIDDVERVTETVKKSLDAARWAHDHRDVLSAAGNVAHHIARMKGLAAARFEDADAEDLTAQEAKAEGADIHGAMVALYPAKAVQEKLAGHLEAADAEPADQIHLTLVFLGPDASEIEGRDKIEAAVKAAAAAQAPLRGEVGGIAAFRGQPDGDLRPIIATVDVVGLNEFRARLMGELEKAGVAPEETHGFTPHITLRYAPKSEPVPEPPDALPLEFDDVVLVWDEKKTVFPLGG